LYSANDQRWEDKVVGQEDQRLADVRILETYAPQVLWIMLSGKKPLSNTVWSQMMPVTLSSGCE
jgi:hypothetical protein